MIMFESSVCFMILGVSRVVSYSISCAISVVIRRSIRCVYWSCVVIQGYFVFYVLCLVFIFIMCLCNLWGAMVLGVLGVLGEDYG
jgi:hypothetical protein